MAKKCRRIIFCTFLNTHKKAGADEVAEPPRTDLAGWAGETRGEAASSIASVRLALTGSKTRQKLADGYYLLLK